MHHLPGGCAAYITRDLLRPPRLSRPPWQRPHWCQLLAAR